MTFYYLHDLNNNKSHTYKYEHGQKVPMSELYHTQVRTKIYLIENTERTAIGKFDKGKLHQAKSRSIHPGQRQTLCWRFTFWWKEKTKQLVYTQPLQCEGLQDLSSSRYFRKPLILDEEWGTSGSRTVRETIWPCPRGCLWIKFQFFYTVNNKFFTFRLSFSPFPR